MIDHNQKIFTWSHISILTGYILLILFLSSIFFVGQLKWASRKSFWLDERFCVEIMEKASYKEILLGHKDFASPAPLDYLIQKPIFHAKYRVNFLGFQPLVYFRLWPNFMTLFSGLFAVFLFSREIIFSCQRLWIKSLQYFVMIGMLGAYFFTVRVYHYAAEYRTYALWNCLWLIALVLFFLKKPMKKTFRVVMVLLSFTSTAAVFQFISLMIAQIGTDWLDQKRKKEIFVEILKTYFIPFIIVVFYGLKAPGYGYDLEGDWDKFMKFWKFQAYVFPLMLSVLFLFFLKVSHRFNIRPPLAVLIFYLLCPIITLIAEFRGVFFAPRYFIGLSLIVPIFLLSVCKLLPIYLSSFKKIWQKSAVILFIIIGVPSLIIIPKDQRIIFSIAAQESLEVLNNPSIILRKK